MNKDRGNTQFRKVIGSKLGRFAGRMQGIRQQQESIGQAGVFGSGHARLAAAIRLSSEVQRNTGGKLTQFLRGLADAMAVAFSGTAGGATGTQLAKRQIPAQNTISGFTERVRDSDHQKVPAIASRAVG